MSTVFIVAAVIIIPEKVEYFLWEKGLKYL